MKKVPKEYWLGIAVLGMLLASILGLSAIISTFIRPFSNTDYSTHKSATTPNNCVKALINIEFEGHILSIKENIGAGSNDKVRMSYTGDIDSTDCKHLLTCKGYYIDTTTKKISLFVTKSFMSDLRKTYQPKKNDWVIKNKGVSAIQIYSMPDSIYRFAYDLASCKILK